MTMVQSAYVGLVDDGTLDTVIECFACETQGRYNFDPDTGDESYSDFVEWAINDFDASHVCDDGTDE